MSFSMALHHIFQETVTHRNQASLFQLNQLPSKYHMYPLTCAGGFCFCFGSVGKLGSLGSELRSFFFFWQDPLFLIKTTCGQRRKEISDLKQSYTHNRILHVRKKSYSWECKYSVMLENLCECSGKYEELCSQPQTNYIHYRDY